MNKEKMTILLEEIEQHFDNLPQEEFEKSLREIKGSPFGKAIEHLHKGECMTYKCDHCEYQVCEPPSNEEPHGAFYCRRGHWEGTGERDKAPLNDPWKFCKDYKPNY